MLKQYLTLPRAIHILCVGAFINRAGAFLVPFLTLYLRKKLDLGTEFATQAMGIYGVGAMAAFALGGHLADRLGRRTVMLISLLGSGSILLVFGWLSSPWAILAALLLFALVAEMYRPAASAMIADLVAPDRRPEAFGLMYVSINLGFAVAATVGGVLARYSFQWLFWGDALTALVYAGIIFLTIRETMPGRRDRGTMDDVEPPPGALKAGPQQSVTLGGAAKHILTDRTFMVFWTGSFFLTAMFVQALSTFPLYIAQLGIGADIYGRIIAVNGLMIVFLQLPTTSIVSRHHRGVMVTMSALVMALGFGLTAVATVPWQLGLTVVVWTVGEMMHAPLMSAIISDIAPVHLRARYMGAHAISFSAALMTCAPLGGLVLEHFGGPCLWTLTGVAGLVAGVAFWSMRNHILTRREPSIA